MYVCCVCIFLIERNAFDFDNLIKSYSKHSSIVVTACNKRSYKKSVFCMKKKAWKMEKNSKRQKVPVYVCKVNRMRKIRWEREVFQIRYASFISFYLEFFKSLGCHCAWSDLFNSKYSLVSHTQHSHQMCNWLNGAENVVHQKNGIWEFEWQNSILNTIIQFKKLN